MSIVSIFYLFHSLDYYVVFSLVPYVLDHDVIFFNYVVNNLEFICLFLFLGAVGKSAQLVLHT